MDKAFFFALEVSSVGFVSDCSREGWKISSLPVEVEYRRIPLRDLILHSAFQEKRKRITSCNNTDAAENSLRYTLQIHGNLHPGHKLRLNKPWLGHLGKGV